MITDGPSMTDIAQIGIQVEPLAQIEARQTSAVATAGNATSSSSEQSTTEQFTMKMLNNFVNHVQSFAVLLPKQAENPLGQKAEFVPLSTVHDWFNTFRRRLQINPNFWKTLN